MHADAYLTILALDFREHTSKLLMNSEQSNNVPCRIITKPAADTKATLCPEPVLLPSLRVLGERPKETWVSIPIDIFEKGEGMGFNPHNPHLGSFMGFNPHQNSLNYNSESARSKQ